MAVLFALQVSAGEGPQPPRFKPAGDPDWLIPSVCLVWAAGTMIATFGIAYWQHSANMRKPSLAPILETGGADQHTGNEDTPSNNFGWRESNETGESSNILDVGIGLQQSSSAGNEHHPVAGNLTQSRGDASSSEYTSGEDESDSGDDEPDAGQLMPISEEQEGLEQIQEDQTLEVGLPVSLPVADPQTLEVDSTIAIPASHAVAVQDHSQSVGSFKSVDLHRAAGSFELPFRDQTPSYTNTTTAPTDVVLHVSNQPSADRLSDFVISDQQREQHQQAATAHCGTDDDETSRRAGSSKSGRQAALSQFVSAAESSASRPASVTSSSRHNTGGSGGGEGGGGGGGGKSRNPSTKDKDSGKSEERKGLPNLKRGQKGKESEKEREKGKDKKTAKAKAKRRDLDQ